ncbi:hypothetical protein [Brevundimonas sp.]|uniref:hypothetical protein n=1 Tax=Brevundimonas sp. TaxID=1871086 RepID=UPI00272EFB83|nr:hypothetical protein [Brevundimonas sp.]MDP1911821.1 hypothetical protein [Brevundimonas sp.]
MIRLLSSLRQDDGGHSAVEFAIIVPVLIIVVAAGYLGWEAAGRQQNLRAALSVAADYYMAGGKDDKVAAELAMAGWDKPPPGAVVEVTRTCACGSAIMICSTTCSSAAPAIYVEILGRAYDPDAQVSKVIIGSRTLRVR